MLIISQLKTAPKALISRLKFPSNCEDCILLRFDGKIPPSFSLSLSLPSPSPTHSHSLIIPVHWLQHSPFLSMVVAQGREGQTWEKQVTEPSRQRQLWQSPIFHTAPCCSSPPELVMHERLTPGLEPSTSTLSSSTAQKETAGQINMILLKTYKLMYKCVRVYVCMYICMYVRMYVQVKFNTRKNSDRSCCSHYACYLQSTATIFHTYMYSKLSHNLKLLKYSIYS